MATNMTVHDVLMTQGNDLSVMWCSLHKSTPVAKDALLLASKQQRMASIVVQDGVHTHAKLIFLEDIV